jgi:hypothetical protein
MTHHTRLIRTLDSAEIYAHSLAWHPLSRTQKQWAGPLGSEGRRQASDAWMMRYSMASTGTWTTLAFRSAGRCSNRRTECCYSPPPQRYCQAIPTAQKSLSVRL